MRVFVRCVHGDDEDEEAGDGREAEGVAGDAGSVRGEVTLERSHSVVTARRYRSISMNTGRFLVTAGNMREMIDRVRDWGNIFTGNTGYSIAKALAALGSVDLLTSNCAHVTQAAGEGIRASAFTSHAELKGTLAALLAREKYDAIFMTAAVADYKPAGVFAVVERRPGEAGLETWVVKNAQAGKVRSESWRNRGPRQSDRKNRGPVSQCLGPHRPAVQIQAGSGRRNGRTASHWRGEPRGKRRGLPDRQHARNGRGRRGGAYLLSKSGHEFIPRPELAARLAGVVREALTRQR